MKKLLLTFIAILALCGSVYATAQTDYDAAKKAFEAKNYEEALTLYDSAIKANSKYVDAYCGKGETLLELQKNEEAIKAFTKVISLDPKNAKGYEGRAAAYGAAQNGKKLYLT